MKRQNIYYAVGSMLLAVYICVAVAITRAAAKNNTFDALKICIADSAATGFVTTDDVDVMLNDLSTRITKTRHSDINTMHMENALRAHDNIENAKVMVLANGTLLVNVEPMQPVARIFSADTSYYVNAAGKKISANARCHVDVPVVTGVIRDSHDVARLLPMFKYLKSKPEYNAYVTQVELADNGDIYIIPAVAGHVVNLGDTSAIADKMERLHTFYSQVMPQRGWEYYDALSVKWRGRVVATRAAKRQKIDRPVVDNDSVNSDLPNTGTMSPTGIPIQDPDIN